MFPVLCDLFDDIEVVRVLNEPDLYIPEALGKALGLRTAGGRPKEMVQPDVLVLPAGTRLPKARVLRICRRRSRSGVGGRDRVANVTGPGL